MIFMYIDAKVGEITNEGGHLFFSCGYSLVIWKKFVVELGNWINWVIFG